MTESPRSAGAPSLKHLPGLDGVRGIAILLVLLFHSITTGPSAALIDRIVTRVASFGWAGVDLFFVLSGFLITGILLDSKGRPDYFRNFYARRALRIFPLYYLFLIAAIVIVPAITPDPALIDPRMHSTQWWHWTYCVNVLIALRGPEGPPADTGHFWSLAVEEQFYLVWPTVVFLCSRVSFKRVVISTIVGAWILRMIMVANGADDFTVYVLTPTRADALAAGALLAVLAREPGGLQRFRKWALPMGLAASALIVVDFFVRHRLYPNRPEPFQLDSTFVAMLAAAVILAALNSASDSSAGKFFRSPTLRFFGRYSYCLYVVHVPLIHFLERSVLPRESFPRIGNSLLPGTVLFVVLAIGLSVCVSLLSWQFVESPMLRLKRFFPTGGAQAMGASSPTIQGASGAG